MSTTETAISFTLVLFFLTLLIVYPVTIISDCSDIHDEALLQFETHLSGDNKVEEKLCTILSSASDCYHILVNALREVSSND